MTPLADCWREIERFCSEGDRNGLLVAADALAELGEEEMACTIRWVVRKQKDLPAKTNYWYLEVFDQWTCSHMVVDPLLVEFWQRINRERIAALEYYK